MNCPPVLALCDPSRSEHADFFWRLERPITRLREAGVDAQVCWTDANGIPTLPVAGRVVIIQRTSFIARNEFTGAAVVNPEEIRAWIASLRTAGALAVVAEIDDDTVSPAYLDWLDASGGLELVKRQRLVAEQIAWKYAVAAVDAVTCSTEPLAAVVRRYTPAPVHVVANAIDVDWFRERLSTRVPWADHLTIGWAGGRRPEADLLPMAIAWGRIARRYPDVRFVVAGWQPDCIYDQVEDIDRIYRVPWQGLDDYPAAMQVSIGCCPLANTDFNRCKSPIKAWEYGLAGAAVVRSGYGFVYREGALQRSGTGRVATDAESWFDNLEEVVRSAWWRGSFSRNLAFHVERQHSLARNLDRWATVYSEIAASAGVKA
jgi:glycosyltransferase involved in cell wall biosynthesis